MGIKSVITLCGPRKHDAMMMDTYNKLTAQANAVFIPYLGNVDDDNIDIIHDVHYEKIRMSSEVWVIDLPNADSTQPYYGEDTKREIEFAKSIGVNVVYLSQLLHPELTNKEEEE